MGIAEFSEHEADRGEFEEGEGVAVVIFPIPGESAAAVEPGDAALDNPALGQHDEALQAIGAPHDVDFDVRQDFGECVLEHRAGIGAVGDQRGQKREPTEEGGQHGNAAVAVLNFGGMNDGVQQKTLGIDEDVPLLALDQLARVEAVRIDAGPPFSALFTLWLSMMPVVGLASRSARSRHLT